jgi:hypothetical protein
MCRPPPRSSGGEIRFMKKSSTSNAGNRTGRAQAAPAIPQETLARIRESRQSASVIRRELRKHADFLGETAIDLVAQRFFDQAMQKDAGARDLVAIMSVVLRAREQALEARRLKLQEAERENRRRPARVRRAGQGLSEEALAEVEDLAVIL